MKAIIVLIAFLFFLQAANLVLAAFTIYNVSPSTVNSSEDIVTITASASSLQNTAQYVQIGLTKEGESSNYFGFTKNLGEEWYKYKSSPATSDLSSYFYSFTPSGGVWNGQIFAKVDVDDSGFKGAGNYILKLFKYITSSPSYSNTFTIVVNITSTPTPTPTDTPTPTPVPTSTPTPTPTPTKTPTPTLNSTPTSKLLPTSVLGESTESGEIVGPTDAQSSKENALTLNKTENKSNNWLQKILIIIGGIFLVACAILSFRFYINNKKQQEV